MPSRCWDHSWDSTIALSVANWDGFSQLFLLIRSDPDKIQQEGVIHVTWKCPCRLPLPYLQEGKFYLMEWKSLSR